MKPKQKQQNKNKMYREELLLQKSRAENTLRSIDVKLEAIKNNEKDEIKRKDSVKNKTRLSELTSSDRVFKVSYWYSKKEVTWAGYVDVRACNYSEEDNYYSFSVEHKTKPEGFSTGFNVRYKNEHCVLLDFTSSLYFITMKPQTWERDMKLALKNYVDLKKERYDEKIKNFTNHGKEMVKSYDEYKKKQK